MIKSILLATDGSAPSRRAAEFTASLARHYHSKIVVLHAYTPVPGHQETQTYSRSLYETVDQASSLVKAVAQHLEEMGVPQVETDIMEGPAAHVIIGVAESCSPDLIVIGARGTSTWQGMLLGSVSQVVMQRAECPVLVVK